MCWQDGDTQAEVRFLVAAHSAKGTDSLVMGVQLDGAEIREGAENSAWRAKKWLPDQKEINQLRVNRMHSARAIAPRRLNCGP